MIDLLIVTPGQGLDQHVPAGFLFANQVFSEAKLENPVGKSEGFAVDLERTLKILVHRYPGRVRVRWVSPWSFSGLWLALRYRLRDFPAVIVNLKEVLTGEYLSHQALTDYVDGLLSQPAGSG